MKAFCLVILTLAVLYNPKVKAAYDAREIILIETASSDADRFVIKKKNPLKDIAENTRNYAELMRIFKDLGQSNVQLSLRLLDKIQNHNTLSGDDLYLIKRSFETFTKVNKLMLEFADLYQFRSSTMSKTFARPENKMPMVKSHLIWLSSHALLMDQIESLHKILYLTDGAFRRIFKTSIDVQQLSQKEKEHLKQLGEMVKKIVMTVESAKFQQQVIMVKSIASDLKVILKNDEVAKKVLSEVVENKISKDIAQGRTEFKMKVFAQGDAVIRFFNRVTNILSGLFGNIAGAIHWREGHLLNNETALEIAKKSLRPMDIILEKSPFVLTDKFIPGHFGHVAIYLGTRTQLEEIGMWNHPDIEPYQSDIEAGKTILEAVRPGVRLNSVDAFMNIDEFTIMRKSDGLNSNLQVSEQISRGMNQIGKSYDFNFDISTLDKIVCSELIYIVFGHVSWPTRYRLGRPTVTPDDIAEVMFQKGTHFQMTDYVLSTERHRVELQTLDKLADTFEYELRAENGDVPQDPKDPANSFWKKETKCYNVSVGTSASVDMDFDRRECKTTYKQYFYEETSGI